MEPLWERPTERKKNKIILCTLEIFIYFSSVRVRSVFPPNDDGFARSYFAHVHQFSSFIQHTLWTLTFPSNILLHVFCTWNRMKNSLDFLSCCVAQKCSMCILSCTLPFAIRFYIGIFKMNEKREKRKIYMRCDIRLTKIYESSKRAQNGKNDKESRKK